MPARTITFPAICSRAIAETRHFHLFRVREKEIPPFEVFGRKITRGVWPERVSQSMTAISNVRILAVPLSTSPQECPPESIAWQPGTVASSLRGCHQSWGLKSGAVINEGSTEK